MSSTLKAVLGVILLLIIAGLVYWFMTRGGSQSTNQATTATTTETAGSSLDDMLAAIDGQISAFDSDNASVSAGLSDQPVSQSSI